MIELTEDEREELAAYAHKAWTGWMLYMFGKCKHKRNGTMVMPEWAVSRWACQEATSYADLSEEEKRSDRDEAEKMWDIMGRYRREENIT